MTENKLKLLGALMLSGIMTVPANAQVIVHGSNGSATALQPISITQAGARRMGFTSVRTDYVGSMNQYFVVAYDHIPSAAVQQRIATVASNVSYLPDYIYIYKASDAKKALDKVTAFAKEDGLTILGTGALPLQFKMSQGLYDAYAKKSELSAEVQQGGLEVSVFDHTDLIALQQTLEQWGLTYTESVGTTLTVTSGVSLSLVEQLAALPYVGYVMESILPHEEDYEPLDYIMATNSPHLINYDRKGPIGRGIYFMNWELYGGQDFFPIVSYGRRLTGALTDNTVNAHGSNCGAIAVGANNLNEWNSGGMAPGATLIAGGGPTKTYNQISGLAQAIADGYSPMVSNHSVGWAYGQTGYIQTAAIVDRVTLESNAYINCYSAGNASDSIFKPFTVAGYGSYSGGIKSNKNGFNVHSVGLPTIDVNWASFGPSSDGRINPQICAQGTGGTSYASPGVAGMATLLMEQFETTYNQKARADVVKAVMMNTAMLVRTFIDKATRRRVDAVNYINYRTGYGEINPTAAVAAIKEQRVRFGEKVAQGDDKVVELTVPADQAELRFMLYWNDLPATPGTSKALINDLDLEVEAPDGTIYLPWTLDPSPANVTNPPVRKADHLNNAEQVIIRAKTKDQLLPAGTYKVHIKGYHIPFPAQQPEYVLTWQFRPRGIIMTSIPEGYRVNQGDNLLITWDMTLAEDEDLTALNVETTSGRPGAMTPFVKYRTKESGRWITLGRKAGNYGKNFFRYPVPSTLQTSELQFQITADDLTAETNKVMVEPRISDRPTIHSISADKVKLSWKASTKTTEGKYYIHALYDKYMTIVDSVDMPTTEKEVLAPAGHAWTQNDLFAISVHNTKTGAKSQRSLPAGLDQSNEYLVNADAVWDDTYDLCGDMEKTLKTIDLEGDIRWYKVNASGDIAISDADGGNLSSRTFQREDYGQYYYTVSTTGTSDVIFKSKTVAFNRPSVELSDTINYGDGIWNGYVFYNKNGNYTNLPLLANDAPYYGRFTLNKLGFNSHTDLFEWTKGNAGLTPYAGYVGCDVPGDANYQVVVMKRKNFIPGEYTFQISRGSMRAQLIFRDRLGGIIKEYTAPVNANGNAEAVTVTLDENSTCELRWVGNHLNLLVTAPTNTHPIFSGFESGQFYRITSAYPAFYTQQGVTKNVYLRTNNLPGWTTADKTDVSQLWKMEDNSAWPTVSVKNANASLYLEAPTVAGTSGANAITFTSLSDDPNQFQFGLGTKLYAVSGSYSGTGTNGGFYATTTAKSNTVSAFYLEKTSTIQLKVGENGYASVYYPFAITIPNLQHFAAYTVSGLDADGRTLKGDLIPAGTTIAANTPIIFGALSGVYELPIAPANTDAPASSLLQGMNTAMSLPSNAYVLGFDPMRGIGYVPSNSAYALIGAVGANRTYYLAPASAGDFVPVKLSPVTGIGSVTTTDNTKSTLHDASGRHLNNAPQRGFYIKNGKKIYK